MQRSLQSSMQREIFRKGQKPTGVDTTASLNQAANPVSNTRPGFSPKNVLWTVQDYVYQRHVEVEGPNRISFTASTTIADSSSGLDVFSTSDTLRVQGSESNDGFFLPQTVVAGSITTTSGSIPIVTEAAGTYTVRLTTVETPELGWFINKQLPAPGNASDGFNEMMTWSQLAENGELREGYIPKNTNRRYSTYLYSQSPQSGGLAVQISIRWDKQIRIIMTDESGLETILADTSDISDQLVDGVFNSTIPIRQGKTRLDVLIYNPDKFDNTLNMSVMTNEVYAASAPLPALRIARVQGKLDVEGDGNWQEQAVSPETSFEDTTVSFDDKAITASTVSFVDPFTHVNDVDFATTTITRNDGGSFVSDGFEIGMDVTVGGSSVNDGTFTGITNVTASVLTISGGSAETGSTQRYVTIKGQAAIKDSGNGLGIFSATDLIVIEGSSENDTHYTADYVAGGGGYILVTGKVTDEAAGASITVRTKPEINDSGSGFGSFSAGNVILVTTTSGVNDGTYLVDTAAAGKLTLSIFDTLTTETAGAAGTTTIIAGPTTHFDDVGFQVRDAALQVQLRDLYPERIAYNTEGHDPAQQGLYISDTLITGVVAVVSHSHGLVSATITGNTGSGSSHSHGSGSYSTGSDGSHDHGGAVSSDGSHSHSVSGTSSSESSHTHPVGTLDVGGTTDIEAAHQHANETLANNGFHLEDPQILSGGAKTEKDTVYVLQESELDEADTDVVDVEIKRDTDGLIEPAVFARRTASTISFSQTTLTAATISFVNVQSSGVFTFNSGSPSTITRASGNFSTDGHVAGRQIRVFGTAFNDGVFTLQTVAANTLTLAAAHSLVDETTQRTILINGQSEINDSGSGMGSFAAGMDLIISTATGEIGRHRIGSAAAGQLLLSISDILQDMSAGTSITLKGNHVINDATGGIDLADYGFVDDMRMSVSGSGSNDGNFIIREVSNGDLWVDIDESVATEAAGASITLESIGKDGFYIRWKVANGRRVRINYQVIAWGGGIDKPYDLL